jgi:hypothetical protein
MMRRMIQQEERKQSAVSDGESWIFPTFTRNCKVDSALSRLDRTSYYYTTHITASKSQLKTNVSKQESVLHAMHVLDALGHEEEKANE